MGGSPQKLQLAAPNQPSQQTRAFNGPSCCGKPFGFAPKPDLCGVFRKDLGTGDVTGSRSRSSVPGATQGRRCTKGS